MATDEADRRLAAPGDLELVRDFVNTRDLEKGTDRIDGPEKLASWSAEKRLVTAEAPRPARADVERALRLREALRAMLRANAGFPLVPRSVEEFNEASHGARLCVRTGDDGRVALLAAGEGIDRAVGRLLSVVVAAQKDGTWERLKACAGCQWALYDRTKNRSAAWCDAAKCGARARSRRYRARRRGTPALGDR